MNHETTQHTAHPHGSHSGESVRDPVCGMNVDPKPASESDSFAGQTYFFCSQIAWRNSGASRRDTPGRGRRLRWMCAPVLRPSRGSTRVRCIPRFGSRVRVRVPSAA